MAAKISVGRLEPFDEHIETWDSYSERLEQYFIANEIKPETKVPALLSVIGGRTYGILRDLTAPAKPATKSYDELVETLSRHLSPKPLLIAERFRFYKRDQKEGEGVRDYIAQLRKFSEHCEFGTVLDDALRDRFVCGLSNEMIQRKLLSVKTLTFEKAVDIAVAMDTASRDAVELQAKHVQKPVHSTKVNKTKTVKSNPKPCYRCLRTGHDQQDCFYKSEKCRKCGKIGHIQKACRQDVNKATGNKVASSKPWNRSSKKVHAFDTNEDLIGHVELYSIGSNKSEPFWITPQVNGKSLSMELDTGSEVSVMSRQDFSKHFGKEKLYPTTVTLKTYSGEPITPCGKLDVTVELNGQKSNLPLYVIEKGGPPLFGRSWLRSIRLDWAEIHAVSGSKVKLSIPTKEVENIVEKYADVFDESLGTLKDIKASLHLKDGCTPKFLKARPLAYSLRPAVEKELDRLVDLGILEPVEHSEWATPIVAVPKRDGTIRLCGDFKTTINPVLQIDKYPLPKVDDIFANLSGGKHFTKLDLRHAYLQMKVEEDHRKYLTINTHRGLFRYNRLVFGIASAPAIWQRAMEQILQGTNGTQCILDDMIITGRSTEEHLLNLDAVLSRLQKSGLKANLDKCNIFQDKVQFCGHIIDQEGLHKTQDKIEAVVNAVRPENVTHLRAFLGLVNYYGKFMENLSMVLRPLHHLLEKNVPWKWTTECQQAFNKVKNMMVSDKVLAHYDPNLPVALSCDASPYGLGAVLSHKFPDGTERPIAYASRSLNNAEKNYSQIDKEALGIIWGIKRFNVYLYGRNFTLVTDHQPLVSIFSPQKGISTTSSSRLQRYAIFLSGYDYTIKYRNTKLHGDADGLSRMPQKSRVPDANDSEEDIMDEAHIFQVSQMERLPVTSSQLRKETSKDKLLAVVYDAAMRGWNKPEDKTLLPFYERRNEITVHQGCLLWGIRVIIPQKLQREILEEIHTGHLGVVKMKSLARSYIWWPGMDSEIENLAKKCSGCQVNRNTPREAPVHPWEFPLRTWQRIHIDFAGPFLGAMFLIIVDAYSKWPEVVPMQSTTATRTIDRLREVFARTGIPEQIVSDNGPQFTSQEFADFIAANGIRHITSAPFHPRTNGLAERFVQTFKQAMKSSRTDDGTLQKKLSKFLLAYRNTEHSTTQESPATLFMGRKLRTRLDLLKPDLSETVRTSQEKMCSRNRSTPRSFDNGDPVVVRDYRGGDKWTCGTVQSRTGPVSYKVKVNDRLWRRHTDQLAKTGSPALPPPTDLLVGEEKEVSVEDTVRSDVTNGKDGTPTREQSTMVNAKTVDSRNSCGTPKSTQPTSDASRRYPCRTRRAPKRLDL